MARRRLLRDTRICSLGPISAVILPAPAQLRTLLARSVTTRGHLPMRPAVLSC
jgi:hypothetical protein